jgi:ADP-ribosylarginine hydrolase
MDNITKLETKYTMEDKYIASFVVHSLCDIIGFKNSVWEFNKTLYFNAGESLFISLEASLEYLYEFISYGGINRLNISEWIVSDDTLLHIAIAMGILDNNKPDEKMIEDMKKLIKISVEYMVEDKVKNRYPGVMTVTAVEKFNKKYKDQRDAPYNNRSGGNGCAMRTHCIGLAYHGEKNLDKLIFLAIESSRLTHNSPIGFLGGLASAYFTSLAIEGIDIYLWMPRLLELLNSDKIKKYIDFNNKNIVEDYYTFIDNIKRYIELRFDNGIPIVSKSTKNILFRTYFFVDNFSNKKISTDNYGTNGYSSIICAYDALLDSGDCFEKLLSYTCLTLADSDTVGAIAGGWYGILYGFGDIPGHLLKNMEQPYQKELYEIGKKFYLNFYK